MYIAFVVCFVTSTFCYILKSFLLHIPRHELCKARYILKNVCKINSSEIRNAKNVLPTTSSVTMLTLKISKYTLGRLLSVPLCSLLPNSKLAVPLWFTKSKTGPARFS